MEVKKSRKYYGETEFSYKDMEERGEKNSVKLQYYRVDNPDNSYGIEVIKQEAIGGDIEIEKNEVMHIADNTEMADNIINVLLRNKVTPVALKEVVSDLDYSYVTNHMENHISN